MVELKGILRDWDATGEQIADAMHLGIRNALRDHKRNGVPIATWDKVNRRVLVIPPDQIPVDDEPAA